MTNLQQLLEEKYPNSEISEIQRRAFLEGYNYAKEEEPKSARLRIDELEAQYDPHWDHSDFHTLK